MDSHGDGKGVLFGGFLEAEDEWRFVDGFAEFLRLFGAAGEVVGGLREEDGLDWCELYVFAVKQEFTDLKNIQKAREMYTFGLHFHKKSSALYFEAFKMELAYSEILTQKVLKLGNK